MIRIHGRGVAALACARRLLDRGAEVGICGPRSVNPQPVLLGESTLALIAEIFGAPLNEELGHPLEARMVRWHEGLPQRVPAPGRSVSIHELTAWMETLLPELEIEERDVTSDAPRARWQIDASGRNAPLARRLAGVEPTRFGDRHVVAANVCLERSSNEAVLEAVVDGWLFLLPTAEQRGVLQLMCPSRPADADAALSAALAQCPGIRAWLAGSPVESSACVPAAPSILGSLGSDTWLALGSAACCFDPLCGDGIGSALHGSLLATAVVLSSPGDEQERALAHYHRRYQRSFAMHLFHVQRYYQGLLERPAWAFELASTDRFLRSPTARGLLAGTGFDRQLRDGDLVPTR